MKAQEPIQNTTLNVQTYNQETDKIKNSDDEKMKLFDGFSLESLCGQSATFFCAQSSCYQDAAICGSLCPQCEQRHPNCIDTKIAKNLYKNLQTKIIQLNSQDKKILKQIQKKADLMVDQISQMVNRLKKQIKLFGLHKSDRDISHAILQRQIKQKQTKNDLEAIQILQQSKDLLYPDQGFSGAIIKQFFNIEDSYCEDKFDQMIGRFKSILQSSKQSILQSFDQIQDYLLNLQTKHQQNIALHKYFTNSRVLKKPSQQINNSMFKYLEKVLKAVNVSQYPVKKIFTFRNSVNEERNFQLEKFKKATLDQNDLLFLIENKYGKKYGFFTPRKIDFLDHQWVNDETKKTIIFNLNLNCSQFLVCPQYSLKYKIYPQGISVGGYYEDNSSNQKRNGIQLNFSNNLSGQINMLYQGQVTKNYQPPGGLFGTPNSSVYKDLNGCQKNTNQNQSCNYHQIVKLQVYKFYRKEQQSAQKTQ